MWISKSILVFAIILKLVVPENVNAGELKILPGDRAKFMFGKMNNSDKETEVRASMKDRLKKIQEEKSKDEIRKAIQGVKEEIALGAMDSLRIAPKEGEIRRGKEVIKKAVASQAYAEDGYQEPPASEMVAVKVQFETYVDATGMSDEERDVIMANYDRTSRRYERDDEDGLFDVISKAYVRNLERVFKSQNE